MSLHQGGGAKVDQIGEKIRHVNHTHGGPSQDGRVVPTSAANPLPYPAFVDSHC